MCSYGSISMERYLLVGKKRERLQVLKICTIACVMIIVMMMRSIDDGGSSIGFVHAEISKKGEKTSFLINAHSILYENKSYYA